MFWRQTHLLWTPWVSAKFELRYESLKNKFSLILFAYNLMIGYSKKNIENYPRECFWWKETACEQALCLGKGWKNREVHRLEKKKKPRLKFNPGLALTEPSRTFTDNHSLRSRRLEVVGEKENGRARGRHERGVVSCRFVRVSLSRARFFVCHTNSKNSTQLKIRKSPTG